MILRVVFLVITSLLLIAEVNAQISGCTDSLAINYNPAATVNDGSCIYDAASLAPLSSTELSPLVSETSGLTFWNNLLWTHNDNTDTKLYGLDTLNGNIIQTYLFNSIANIDWEEVSADDEYLYIGDFGNNLNGNRTDLKILRISKASILAGNPAIDTISYHYSDQVDFSPTGANNTDFDCEAMIVSVDSIYLFTKQWISRGTAVYSLPKIPGSYTASRLYSFQVEGLVTGAAYLEQQRLVMLSGYSGLLSPFTWLLYDFSGNNFFGGNKRKISVSMSFRQVEAIATINGLKVYMTNESFVQPPIINNPQQLHIFDFSPLLANYLNNQVMNIEVTPGEREVFLFPNPATGFVSLKVADSLADMDFRLVKTTGALVETGKLTGNSVVIDVSGLNSGIYLLKIGENNRHTLKLIKR